MDSKALIEALAGRVEEIVRGSGDQQGAMDQIAAEAEKIGLLDSNADARTDSVQAFVMDLLTDNPRALD